MRNEQSTVEVLYCSKSRKKVQLGIYSIENAERRSAGYSFHWKGQSKGRLEIFFTEKAKMRYSFVPNCTWWGGESNKM